jgi:hypothetical protein
MKDEEEDVLWMMDDGRGKMEDAYPFLLILFCDLHLK